MTFSFGLCDFWNSLCNLENQFIKSIRVCYYHEDTTEPTMILGFLFASYSHLFGYLVGLAGRGPDSHKTSAYKGT